MVDAQWKERAERAEAEVAKLRHTEALYSNDAMRWDEEMKQLEAERDRYKGALQEIVQLVGKPNLQIVRASLIARAALDQQKES
jgi:hypothetical protein